MTGNQESIPRKSETDYATLSVPLSTLPTNSSISFFFRDYTTDSLLYFNNITSPHTDLTLNGSSSTLPTIMDQNTNPSTALFGVRVVLTVLFSLIVLLGLAGNTLVVVVILSVKDMRKSPTNVFIINLAAADLIIMVFGIPEMVLFQLDRGYLFGPMACRINRFLMCLALYSSVISLVVLCIERFMAIMNPFKKVKAGFSRKKPLAAVCIIWLAASFCAMPVVLYNRTKTIGIPFGTNVTLCLTILPGNDSMFRNMVYKLIESVLFYIIPMLVQILLYFMISKRLFASNRQLSTRFQLRPASDSLGQTHGSNRSATSREMKAMIRAKTTSSSNHYEPPVQDHKAVKDRKGVVKMLIATVLFYFLSYSPVQIHLYYKTFYGTSSILDSWNFFAFTMVLTHMNSAVNPILYAIFSQKFRRHFKRYLCFCQTDGGSPKIMSVDSSHHRSSGTSKSTYVSKV